MEIERLTIKNGEIGFYGDIYNKCSNKNDPKIRKQIEAGKQYCDIKGYKYRQYSHKELSAIYKKLSLFEDIMEKHLIETPEMLDVRLSENSNVNKMFTTKLADLETKLAEKEKYIEEQEFAEYKEMFYATQALKEDCELKIIGLEKQLAEKDAEIKRWKEHKEWDCKTIQEQGDTIEELELSLKRACEAVFDEEIPYDEIQEMKRKHNRYTVGIVLEDVLFYYKKLAEEELKDV